MAANPNNESSGADDSKETSTKFVVMVDDNYHFMDEGERYKQGEYDTAEEAVQAAKSIIDDFLTQGDPANTTAEALFSAYKQFGEDPYIPNVYFSAWDYAWERCQQLCAPSSK